MTLQDRQIESSEVQPNGDDRTAPGAEGRAGANRDEGSGSRSLMRSLLPLLLIAGGVLIAWIMVVTRKSPTKVASAERSIVVETEIVTTGRAAPEIAAYGTVAPLRSLTVRPQVAGLVTEISPRLLAGGKINEGELLFSIDPRDYELNIDSARADLINARFELEIERGRASIAETEWDLLEGTLDSSEEGRRLALRQPHAEERAARVAAAESRLARAELDLARTSIRSPFPALVISENLEKGQLLTMGVETARIVDTRVYVVEVSLPASRLARIPLPDADGNGGALASVQLEGVPDAPVLEGRVARLLGEVDSEGRMARLQIEVLDPLGLDAEGPAGLPLLVGAYARVSMEGVPLENVAELPRAALREGNTIWLRNADGRLEVREVEVMQGTPERVWVRGLSTGLEVVISTLSAPLPGLLLKALDSEGVESAPLKDREATGAQGAAQ